MDSEGLIGEFDAIVKEGISLPLWRFLTFSFGGGSEFEEVGLSSLFLKRGEACHAARSIRLAFSYFWPRTLSVRLVQKAEFSGANKERGGSLGLAPRGCGASTGTSTGG